MCNCIWYFYTGFLLKLKTKKYMYKLIKSAIVTAAILVALFSSKQHDAKVQTQASAKMSKATTASVNEPQSFSIVNLLTLKCM